MKKKSPARGSLLAKSRVMVPRPSRRRFYGYGIPNVDLNRLGG
jgi:hypothetical protein